MATIKQLEERWRRAAETQAEAKQAFDETVRQMKNNGIDPDNEPAVRLVKANLEKRIRAYRQAADELLKEARRLNKAAQQRQ
jgi:glutamate-1-semialdehyde aminotransferase